MTLTGDVGIGPLKQLSHLDNSRRPLLICTLQGQALVWKPCLQYCQELFVQSALEGASGRFVIDRTHT